MFLRVSAFIIFAGLVFSSVAAACPPEFIRSYYSAPVVVERFVQPQCHQVQQFQNIRERVVVREQRQPVQVRQRSRSRSVQRETIVAAPSRSNFKVRESFRSY